MTREQKLLLELFRVIGEARGRTGWRTVQGVIRAFNPHAADRAGLREAWAGIGLGEVSVRNVTAVLERCCGEEFSAGGVGFVLCRMPGAQYAFRLKGTGEEELLRELRMKFSGRELSYGEVVGMVNGDERLSEVLSSCLRRTWEWSTPVAVRVTLGRLKGRNVDGFALVKSPKGGWKFVSR